MNIVTEDVSFFLCSVDSPDDIGAGLATNPRPREGELRASTGAEAYVSLSTQTLAAMMNRDDTSGNPRRCHRSAEREGNTSVAAVQNHTW